MDEWKQLAYPEAHDRFNSYLRSSRMRTWRDWLDQTSSYLRL